MSTAPNPPAETHHGLSLEQVTGITVALTEGFPLDAVLASEQVSPADWPGAEMAWKERIARDGASGPIFTEYAAKRATAEDCLARGVAPIDEDLEAWMGFLRAYGAHPAPAEWMASLGLGMNDLARLQRRWARRLEQDEALAKRARELAEEGIDQEAPKLQVAPRKLVPFPWSKGAARAAEEVESTGPRVAAPAETSLAPGKLRLYSYVAVKARLAESPGREDVVLAELGLTDFAATDAGWQVVLRDNPELRRDYQQLLAAARARAQVTSKQAPPPPPEKKAESVAVDSEPPALPAVKRAPSHLAGTALAVDLPQKPALPFVEPSPEVVIPAPLEEVVRPAPRRDLGGTALALDLPVPSALPFSTEPTEKPAGEE